MSTRITYKDAEIALFSNDTKTLTTQGKYLEADVIVTDTSSAPTLQNKTVTPRPTSQSVMADSGYDGLGTVTVSGDANLVAGNIKKDVSIFGVTGTYEGGGGSSDFTTCTVTFTEQWDEDWIIYVPWVNDFGSTGDMDVVTFLGAGQTITVQCVLYKGLAVGSFPDDSRPSTGTVTTTGGVSYDEDANFINITGDGTLTIG